MKFELPQLPYDLGALEPHISAQTLQFHYGKHHRAYLDKLEQAIGGKELAKQSLEHIVCNSTGGIFNNAAQVWNHSFYWNCMTPKAGAGPTGDLADRLKRDFGSIDEFKRTFAQAAAGQFGSGWAWLVENGDGKLAVLSTGNAGNPMVDGAKPLLTCDVWEHAYYLDYQNNRPAYIDVFVGHLIDWAFVEKNLASAANAQAESA